MKPSSAKATAGKLFAVSDLHLSRKDNRAALEEFVEFAAERPLDFAEDWLIIAGDLGERVEHLTFALDRLAPIFRQLVWTPGNHDLWCPATATDRTRGVARYEELVAECRRFGVLTPEDPYQRWPGDPGLFIVPMFLLFDYSFRDSSVPRDQAVAWARESGVVASDETLLSPAPFPTRDAWCAARCDATEAQLMALPETSETILINHWPLRYDVARPPRIPRFSIWSGTTRTEDWGRRFRARVVINGHLHLRSTLARFGARYEEVSLGYPGDWKRERGLAYYLREIIPGPDDRFVPPFDPFRR